MPLDAPVTTMTLFASDTAGSASTRDANDHAAAYAIEREAYPHMFHIGDALAKVIANRFPKQFSGLETAYSAAGTLRVTLDRLLAEHYFLAAEAMRSGVSGAADLEAGKAAIGANSTDLQAVVRAAYGAKAAAAFRTLWDGHITAYVGYISAARGNDVAGKANATAQVNVYAGQLAGFFAGANPYLDAGALTTMFQQHAGHLIGQVDAFASADYTRTYQLVRTGYSHMFMAGEALALGIATQKPKQFPDHARLPDTATEDRPQVGESSSFGPTGTAGAMLAFGLLVGLSVVALGRRRPR